MMKHKNNKKSKIFIIILLTVTICTYLIFNVLNILRYHGIKPKEIIYTSKVESSIDYNIYLKPNKFIDEPYINNTYSFVSSLVEYIKTSFSYDYTGNSDASVDYDYYIKATITSKYLSDNAKSVSKPLWKKDFILLDHIKGHASNSKFKIAENLNIGLDYYNNLLETFGQTLNIPLESNLDVSFVISINGQLKDEKVVNKEHSMVMRIPLGVKAFDIDVTTNFPEQETIYSRTQRGVETSYVLAIIYIVLIVIIASIAIYLIRAIINNGRDKYEVRVNQILKEYDDRIVTVTNFIRYEKLEIVNVLDFEELLTLSEETMEPIIYWEKITRHDKESWFAIVRNKVLYRYIIFYNK